MKIFVKIFLFFIALLIALSIGFTLFYVVLTSDLKLDESKLFSPKNVITIYDGNENEVCNQSNEVEITFYQDIPKNLVNAFVSIEDKRFFSHNGIDYRAIFRAILKNVKSFSFKEGGSTISQQLIKNTHFTGEKTIKRKLSEIKLARKLEKKFTKEEILEKYLNTIYFGSMSSKGGLPTGELLNKILNTFETLDNFKEMFKESAMKLKGSGYTYLVLDKDNDLKIMNFLNQDCPSFYDLIPLLCIDLWEHAYYINYENNKDLYIDNFFLVMDFSCANKLYENVIVKNKIDIHKLN
jgi:superoxide dismutase